MDRINWCSSYKHSPKIGEIRMRSDLVIKLREYSQRLERIEEIIFEEEDKKFDYNDGTEIRIGIF